MKKVFKILGIFIAIFIIIILLAGIIYKYVIDFETKVPENIFENYDVSTHEVKERNVYIIEQQEDVLNDEEKIIIYFHGGSYFGKGTQDHWNLVENMIKDTGATVIFPDYPLAPKYNYEDVFNMIIPFYEEVVSGIIKQEKEVNKEIELIVLGDSSSGGMALGLLQEMYIQGKEEYISDKTILISPLLDSRLENLKISDIEKKDPILNKEILKIGAYIYAGETGMESHLVNPVLGEMYGINNLTIFTGTNDILNADIEVIVEKSKKANIEIDIREYEGANHVWFIENNSSEELNKKGYTDLISVINE